MNASIRTTLAMAFTAAIVISMPGIAEQVTGLITFTAGTPIKASEVNANFIAVKTAVDGNQAQITALNARIAVLEAKLTNVVALNDYLSLQTVNGHPTVRVSAANLQVVNGEGSTDKINGLGNLVVGYDELRPETDPMTCSASFAKSITTQSTCVSPAVWAVNHKSGSHNLIVGTKNNYSSYGGVVFGEANSIVAASATVTGGVGNVAAGSWSNINGGSENATWDIESSVSGGYKNTASNQFSVVSGGFYNTALGSAATVSGGYSNLASGQSSVVSGGGSNTASSQLSAVSGGSSNTASGYASAVSGGYSNVASGDASVVSGGYQNIASGAQSAVSAGSTNKATGEASAVSGGYNNIASHGGSAVSGGAGHGTNGQNNWVGGANSSY